MKKIFYGFCILIAGISMCVLTSCGGDSASQIIEDNTSANTETVTTSNEAKLQGIWIMSEYNENTGVTYYYMYNISGNTLTYKEWHTTSGSTEVKGLYYQDMTYQYVDDKHFKVDGTTYEYYMNNATVDIKGKDGWFTLTKTTMTFDNVVEYVNSTTGNTITKDVLKLRLVGYWAYDTTVGNHKYFILLEFKENGELIYNYKEDGDEDYHTLRYTYKVVDKDTLEINGYKNIAIVYDNSTENAPVITMNLRGSDETFNRVLSMETI